RYRGDCGQPAAALVADRAVALFEIAIDADAVRSGSVTHIVDGEIELLSPEERSSREPLACTQHVAGGSRALALRHDPMLHAHSSTETLVGPRGDVTGRVDSVHAGHEVLVHGDAILRVDPCRSREIIDGTNARADYDKIRVQCRTVAERRCRSG